jgi:hypothetical protein
MAWNFLQLRFIAYCTEAIPPYYDSFFLHKTSAERKQGVDVAYIGVDF